MVALRCLTLNEKQSENGCNEQCLLLLLLLFYTTDVCGTDKQQQRKTNKQTKTQTKKHKQKAYRKENTPRKSQRVVQCISSSNVHCHAGSIPIIDIKNLNSDSRAGLSGD